MTKWKIYNEDAVEWAKKYEKAKFHALLCDSPYNLESITKRFGKNGSAKAKYGKDGVFQRSSKGFMNQAWDTDIAFRPETWQAFGNVLHDGAFGMAFSASRNWHRMAVAIEDAGFILHPTIFLWAYGQGFPKATRVKGYEDFDGHRYGLQALKPAVEPIIVFQKPYNGKSVENITRTGAGALNIDGGRIPTQDEYVINQFDDGMKPFGNGAGHEFTSVKVKPSRKHKGKVYDNVAEGYKRPNASMYQHKIDWEMQDGGRWPSNLILTEESAERLDAQTGHLTGGTATNRNRGDRIPSTVNYANHNNQDVGFGDSGGASRFFYQVSTQLDEADPAYYCAKVSPKERNAGLDDMPTVLGGSLDGGNDTRDGKNKTQLHHTKNNHPTLKPIDLCKYLATLLLPPVEYAPRRIFVPFSGVASEMIGCGLAGWEHVVGVEFDTENGYVDIAEKRLEHWLK